MTYYVVFITGFSGFLLGLLLSTVKRNPTHKKCSKNCGAKCRVEKAYGDFLDYDGSEKA